MKISPINFCMHNANKACSANNYIPATERYNSLSDMEFNIIADTIKSQNLKNQMNVRLMNLRRSLNGNVGQNFCQNG